MKWLYMSSSRMTVVVAVQDDVIRITPPIVRKFVGQPVDNLRRWLRGQHGGEYYEEEYHGEEVAD